MNKLQVALRGIFFVGFAGALAACNSESSGPTASEDATPVAAAATASNNVSALAVASLRVRCERRSSRSKISVDGRNLIPRNGSFRARVRAAGGTGTSAAKRAVAGEDEFDFDSNPNDIAAGAKRIPANFIAARSGPDVIGEILNGQGQVVASSGADCRLR